MSWAYFTFFLFTEGISKGLKFYESTDSIEDEGFVNLYRVISRNENDSHDPEITICSLRAIIIFFPCKSCFAI